MAEKHSREHFISGTEQGKTSSWLDWVHGAWKLFTWLSRCLCSLFWVLGHNTKWNGQFKYSYWCLILKNIAISWVCFSTFLTLYFHSCFSKVVVSWDECLTYFLHSGTYKLTTKWGIHIHLCDIHVHFIECSIQGFFSINIYGSRLMFTCTFAFWLTGCLWIQVALAGMN